ncbi:MAG: GNAT family N-acetyltransferase [Candidatus Odinarchaeota archaeon]
MRIRPMIYDDLGFALALTSAEGWNSTKRDFEELLEYNGQGCFIGEIDSKPMGMVCTVSYGMFGFIGNLIVIESCRGQQCGKELMEYGINYLRIRGAKSILIDAVPKALTLYERLGFRKICKSLRLEGTVTGTKSSHVRGMTQKDLSLISDLDTSLFGGRRDKFLGMRLAAYPEYCKVHEIDGELLGYIMGSTSGNSVRIGPWAMMESDVSAEPLLLDFAQSVEADSLRIGVLERNFKSLDLLHRYGFREKSFSWRMIYGEDTEATLSNYLYAICCPARG